MIKIRDFEIGNSKTFVIAEIGNNHNGDPKKAYQLVDRAIEIGADCVKFQMRHLTKIYRKRSLSKSGEDLGTEYILDLLNKFELPVEEHRKISEYCKKKGILYLCTPWDDESIKVLESFDVPGYKVASADLTNLPLIDQLAKTKKPLILSTGMSRTDEIKVTVDFLNKRNVDFVLLHCNSTYPAPLHDINLKWIENLKKIHPLVGYSGHERGIAVTIGAVALGACVVERHLTLDRQMEGPDHAASLEPKEFEKLIEGIREIEQALGSSNFERNLSQGEMINRENLAKSLVAATELKKGKVVEAKDIKVLSPGQGLSPQKYEILIGRTLNRDLAEEDFFYETDLQDTRVEPRKYHFKLRWGVPVRYHDFKDYNERITPDLFEFHLSYSDMDLDPANYLSGEYSCDYVVHAPELFAGSHLMDLASPDDNYRKISLKETQRVIDITRNLNKYFPNTKKPLIVANIGGFTMDSPLPKEVIPSYYERIAESLKELDMNGVEIIPQTMAPFPWHFGGQRYQNLFVRIDEIEEWCTKLNLRMCYDVSHSMLTCNYFGFDFYEFSSRIAPYSAHLHLGDAKGLNGEGLQVGEGEINFVKLGEILLKGCPKASFIPEIWQGHKNGGEGFWISLERLEGLL
ncbi:acetylneuraminic acid synthetase [Leptospira perolatii]|uniref:Acetylneuraminic acid synthetase n=1 Tax=Leptospira perolatii TaxID=2023191 RepID=A0A2M9ZL67_9LEPT|nr:N-acetylneuraminate synthase family protein [Leptospira perolatii]PJZ70284.1 acetylneuraminic acid synthetase [Leptospira perolatii]PJZ72832.1 acetylneuraminic acid synthetase [Leptospira perolatii]